VRIDHFWPSVEWSDPSGPCPFPRLQTGSCGASRRLRCRTARDPRSCRSQTAPRSRSCRKPRRRPTRRDAWERWCRRPSPAQPLRVLRRPARRQPDEHDLDAVPIRLVSSVPAEGVVIDGHSDEGFDRLPDNGSHFRLERAQQWGPPPVVGCGCTRHLRGCRVYSYSAKNGRSLGGQPTEESRACAAQTTPSATTGSRSQSTWSQRSFLNEDHVRPTTEPFTLASLETPDLGFLPRWWCGLLPRRPARSRGLRSPREGLRESRESGSPPPRERRHGPSLLARDVPSGPPSRADDELRSVGGVQALRRAVSSLSR